MTIKPLQGANPAQRPRLIGGIEYWVQTMSPVTERPVPRADKRRLPGRAFPREAVRIAVHGARCGIENSDAG